MFPRIRPSSSFVGRIGLRPRRSAPRWIMIRAHTWQRTTGGTTTLHRQSHEYYYSTHTTTVRQSEHTPDASMLEGEVVKETIATSSSEDPTSEDGNMPLMEIQMAHDQEQAERRLALLLQDYQVAKEKGKDHQEQVLLELQSVYEDLMYWDQALQCEQERFALIASKHNAEDSSTYAMAKSWHRKGRYHMHLGMPTDASHCYQQAMTAFTEYYNHDNHGVFHADLGNVIVSMAGVQYAKGAYTDALRILQEAEPHFRNHNAAATENETTACSHPDLFKCLQHQGLVYRGMEEYTQALELYQQAETVLRQRYSETELHSDEKGKLQAIQLDIADMHLVLTQLDEALELYKEVWQSDRASRQTQDPPAPADDGETTTTVPMTGMDGLMLHNIGRIYAQQQTKEDLAVETLQDAVQLKKAWFGPWHFEVAKSLQILGAVHARNHENFKALRCFEHCLVIARNQAGDGNDNHPAVMLALRNIALVEGEKVPQWAAAVASEEEETPAETSPR